MKTCTTHVLMMHRLLPANFISHYNPDFYNKSNTFSTFVSKVAQNQQLCAIYLLPGFGNVYTRDAIYLIPVLFYCTALLFGNQPQPAYRVPANGDAGAGRPACIGNYQCAQ